MPEKIYLQKVFSILSLTVFMSINIIGQTSAEKKEIYQNQQRALSLSFLKSDIKAVEDAPMRCFLETRIAEFIYEKRILDFFDTAESFSLDCLEDIEKNAREFSGSQKIYWKSQTITLLRLNSPETARKAEKKYLLDGAESDLADFKEFDSSKDSNALVSKILAKLSRGEMPSEIIVVIDNLREKDPPATVRLLNGLLNFYETPSNLDESGDNLNFLIYDFLNESNPPELKKRFYNFAVNLGQRAVFETENKDLFFLSRDILKNSLPAINANLPELYPQASLIYATLDGKSSRQEKEKDEVYRRIEESKNKLQQTIAEAEATENKALKDDLWMSAAHLALEQKKFQISVDSIQKIETENESFKKWRVQFLLDDVIDACLGQRDFESAEYALKQVEDFNERGRGSLKIAAKYVELKDNAQASGKLNESLKIIEKSENSAAKVRILFSAVPLALRIDKAGAFNVASSAVKVINNLPTPNTDDKTPANERNEYVENVLLPTAFNIVKAFEILAKENADLSFSIAQEIQGKDWKTAAQIITETEKKYPYTPDKTKKPKTK